MLNIVHFYCEVISNYIFVYEDVTLVIKFCLLLKKVAGLAVSVGLCLFYEGVLESIFFFFYPV